MEVGLNMNDMPRRRGRPPIVATTDSSTRELETATATGATTPKRRRRANVGGAALKLSAPERKGFIRRWVNDDKNKLARAADLAYDFVEDTGIQSSDTGSRISRLVGTKASGEPLRAFLMETPAEEYAAGVAEREEEHRQIELAIVAGRDSTGKLSEEAQYGHGEIKAGSR